MRKHLQQRTMSRPFYAVSFVVFVLCLTLGCARISEIVKKARGEGPPPLPTPTDGRPGPSNANANDSEDTLVKKTNFYITECYNKYSNRVIESHNRYAQWVKNIEQGPTGKESIVYGLYDVNGDGADCETAIMSAKLVDPKMPSLEEAADSYIVALKDVIAQIRGIYSYYEQEDYKDDAFAKAKSAHPALLAAFKAFKDANTVFAAEVDKLEDDVAEKEFARLTDAGKGYEALIVESGIKAKKIKNLLQEKEYEQITADELNPLIEEFGKTVEELKADNSKPMGANYARTCDEFAKTAKELMRRIRDNKKFTESERRFISSGAGWMVEGSPQKVIKAYNDMIQSRRFARF